MLKNCEYKRVFLFKFLGLSVTKLDIVSIGFVRDTSSTGFKSTALQPFVKENYLFCVAQ